MGQENPYSTAKPCYHKDKIETLRAGGQPVPTHVQLIISDLCNQDCAFCAYRWDGYDSNQLFTIGADLAKTGHNNPKRMIDTDKVFEIIGDCAEMGVKAIQFTGGGEPTVHPGHHAFMVAVKSCGMDVSLVTNGVLLKEGTIKFLAAEASWVRVSIDCGNEDSYARIRHVSGQQMRRACHNLSALADEKKRIGSDVVIGVGFTVTRDNWREIEEAAILAKSLSTLR